MEYHQNRYARQLGELVFDGCRWLDLGAGKRLHWGWEAPASSTLARSASLLVGVDFLPQDLRENPDLTSSTLADGGALPFMDGTFDVVTANMLLEHLANPQQVFIEIARVLRPSGRFIFLTPNRGHPAIWLAAVILHPRWRTALSRIVEAKRVFQPFLTHYRANTTRMLSDLAERAGLSVSVLEQFSSFPLTKDLPLVRSIERAWIGAADLPWGARFRSNLIGVLTKPAEVLT